ncbi:reverse transcriptase domain-containing protein, partial [Tanacetum coccineum]
TGKPLTQEEAEREALAISICERYSLLEEERPVIETMAYSDKYKKILDEICVDKRKLDVMNKEDEEAIIRIKGEALIEKDDSGAFVVLIRLGGKINLNALVDTGSDKNVIPYHIYKEL